MMATQEKQEEVNDNRIQDVEMEREMEREVLSPSACSGFDHLSAETCGNILSYCNFPSAHLFARAISRSLRRLLYQRDHYLWKEIFHRQHFSLPEPPRDDTISVSSVSSSAIRESRACSETDYIREIRNRRKLQSNLLLPRKVKQGKIPVRSCCFNLPNRCFHFVPVTPDGHFHQWDDPPPVDWGCDSFVLTSTACGGELVTLDPFHATLAVYENCLDNSVASDEAMMEQAMLQAANIISGNKNLEWDEDMSEEQIAGEVFEQSVYRNHNIDQYKKPPFQILFRLEEDIDPTNYSPNANEDDAFNPRNSDIEIAYHGIDSRTILQDGKEIGSMIAVGRMFVKEFFVRGRRREEVCTELITWNRWNVDNERLKRIRRNHRFGERKICRFPWSFKTIDVCAVHNRVFVTFEADDGPPGADAATIVIYPLSPYPQDPSRIHNLNRKNKQCGGTFRNPETLIRCQAVVSSLAVDPSGDTLVAGSTEGVCEVWRFSEETGSTAWRRTSSVNIKSAVPKAIHANLNRTTESNSAETEGEEAISRLRRALPGIFDQPKIASFHYPSHLPLSSCGFVTLQHSSSDGSSLLLWQAGPNSSSCDDFNITAIVNLPLSSSARAPRVIYDGRRILVYGSDHIGLIILVYHVLNSNDDIHLFHDGTRGETSGGVYNFSVPPRIRFANRIRHAALGGLQYYDSIHMSCNERFIIVNTKTGNCLTDYTYPYAEGLLVIDLGD